MSKFQKKRKKNGKALLFKKNWKILLTQVVPMNILQLINIFYNFIRYECEVRLQL